MGYLSHITGEIKFTPAAKWGEIKDSPFISYDHDAMLLVRNIVVETEEGHLTAKRSDRIVGASDDGFKAYNLLEDVQDIVDLLGTGRTYTGYLHVEGEENEDIWRVYVRDGKAVRVEAKLVWPEGYE